LIGSSRGSSRTRQSTATMREIELRNLWRRHLAGDF
jgi:hypothetical protein